MGEEFGKSCSGLRVWGEGDGSGGCEGAGLWLGGGATYGQARCGGDGWLMVGVGLWSFGRDAAAARVSDEKKNGYQKTLIDED
ncbi:unnamed protein product [Dovyalis caffra]|uniref:Uncharacterized protein n=1 Tax=Dovyalis caffra TaxID=77055 RepID=A0AAV1SFF4_9ROSI|nr:unnamed protein product [Dovyalis caffra]